MLEGCVTFKNYFVCTLEADHDGDHEAYGNDPDSPYLVWENTDDVS